MNREEIKMILPHREPMLLLDTAEKISDTEARGTYRVRGDEFFLQGHFPGHPIVPGVIQCEILAQSACVLLTEEKDKSSFPLYAGMDKIRFRHPIYPGDEMVLETSIIRRIRNIVRIRGSVTVNEVRCMDGELTIAVAELTDDPEKAASDRIRKADAHVS